MSDRKGPRSANESEPAPADEVPAGVGDFRGVVLDITDEVETVPEPPAQPAQPAMAEPPEPR